MSLGMGIGLPFGGGRGKDPRAFGTLVGVWDASFGVTASANLVTAWAPKIGAITLTNAGGTGRPTFVANRGDGRPEISFDGVANYLASIGNIAAITSNYTVIVAGKNGTVANGRMISMWGTGAAGTDILFDFSNIPPCTMYHIKNSSVTGVYTPSVNSQRQIISESTSGVNESNYTSTAGTIGANTLSAAGINTANGGLGVGCGLANGTTPSFSGDCKISLIWLYSTAMTQAQLLAASKLAASIYPVL